MSPDDESHLPQSRAQIPSVKRESTKSFATLGPVEEGRGQVEPGGKGGGGGGAVGGWGGGDDEGERGAGRGGDGFGRGGGEGRGDAHDGAEGCDDLGEDGRRDGLGVNGGVGAEAEAVDGGFVGGDVAWRRGNKGWSETRRENEEKDEAHLQQLRMTW